MSPAMMPSLVSTPLLKLTLKPLYRFDSDPSVISHFLLVPFLNKEMNVFNSELVASSVSDLGFTL